MMFPLGVGRLTESTFSLPLLEKETMLSGCKSLTLTYLLQNRNLIITPSLDGGSQIQGVLVDRDEFLHPVLDLDDLLQILRHFLRGRLEGEEPPSLEDVSI